MPTTTPAEIIAYREQHGIREATHGEMAAMTTDQRWHYDAAAFKPHGVHFETFRHEGKTVRPLYVHAPGRIGFGCESGNLAALRPMPVAQ